MLCCSVRCVLECGAVWCVWCAMQCGACGVVQCGACGVRCSVVRVVCDAVWCVWCASSAVYWGAVVLASREGVVMHT